MNWFNDLRTTTKLFVCFGILCAMLVVVGAKGLSATSEANASVNLAYDRDMRGAVLAHRADSERMVIARSYREALLVGDDQAKEVSRREIDEAERQGVMFLGELAPSLVLRESRERVEEAMRILPEYARLAREAMAAPDRARSLALRTQANVIGLHIDELMDKVVASKAELARREQEESTERYARSRGEILGTTGVAVLLSIVFAMLGGGAIGRPLAAAVGVLERVAAGDLSVSLDIVRKDEVGQLATALNKSLDEMRSTMIGVQDISAEVAAAASQLAAAAEQISSGTQEQAASLEETAASLEEISATVKQNSDNAQQAAQLSGGSRDAAERGGEVVQAAVAAMNEITNSSKKIADIITTIDEIAFQTNLLALNAAVEAARAGEQGRGFGVVAAEVRTLAQRTASAAKEIRGLIADSTSKVEVGTRQVNHSGEMLGEIVRSVKRVTDVVGEIAAASREQNSGIDQVNTAVTQADQVTQSNAAQTEELSATAASLSEKAGHLERLVAGFELGTAKKGKLATPPRASAPSARRAAPPPLAPRRQQAPVSGARRSAAPVAKAANGFEEF